MRAARRLWANLISEKFKPQSHKSLLLRTHCQTSGWSLTAADPFNNIIRTTVEAMAAVLGGTQSLHTNSFDEAVSLPTEFSAHLARNTQLILQEEAMLPKIVDPWGGSYFMESLTAQIEERARSLLEEIESMGGMAVAVASGMPKERIEEAALLKQAAIDSGKITIVGVNKYTQDNAKTGAVEPLTIDNSAVLAKQIEKLKNVKAGRNQLAVQESLKKLKSAAEKDSNLNLLEVTVEAARNRCTLGEISLALETVFTRFTPKTSLVTGMYKGHSPSDDPEITKTIEMCKEFAGKHGRRPRILVAKIGQDGHDRGAKVIASSFADMGFDVEIGPLFQVSRVVSINMIQCNFAFFLDTRGSSTTSRRWRRSHCRNFLINCSSSYPRTRPHKASKFPQSAA